MRFPFLILLIFLVATSVLEGLAQQNDYQYKSEIMWGVTKNSASGLIGGGILKFSKEIKHGYYGSYGVEIVNIKHPNEIASAANVGGRIIYGKQNYFYAIRGQYGREKVVFRKAPQQGVQVSYVLAAGPSIGILAPYYIVTESGTRMQFDPKSPVNISSSGRLFEGIGESSIIPGVNAKVGMLFELGTFKSNVTGFEIGTLVDTYMKKAIIVPNAPNRAIYPTVFVTLFYGMRR